MTTSTERARALRAKRKAAGLEEVRGIWAPPAQHAAIREMVRDPESQKRQWLEKILKIAKQSADYEARAAAYHAGKWHLAHENHLTRHSAMCDLIDVLTQAVHQKPKAP